MVTEPHSKPRKSPWLISLRLRDGSALFYAIDQDPSPVAVAIRIDGLYREFQLVPGVASVCRTA